MSTTQDPTRLVGDVELPAAGIWDLDPGHTEVAFVGRHFGLTKVRGRFTDVTGTVRLGDALDDVAVDIVIDMASVSSGSDDRDEHLRSSDLFDIADHPTATFRSTRAAVDGTSATLVGELTIKGVTREVALDVDYLGHARDPWDNDRAVFSASTTVDRTDWGVSWNMPLAAGGFVVSKEIRLEIEVELIRR